MYDKFSLTGAMSSTINTKSLQQVMGTEDAVYKLAGSNYFKYRAANLMFGFNINIMRNLCSFSQFNSLRKNQLLAFYDVLRSVIGGCVESKSRAPTGIDYYFMAQFEVGQPELIDVHHYTYLIDMCGMKGGYGQADMQIVQQVNVSLNNTFYFQQIGTRTTHVYGHTEQQRSMTILMRLYEHGMAGGVLWLLLR